MTTTMFAACIQQLHNLMSGKQIIPQKILYIITGISGSGKSTLAHELCSKIGTINLSVDDYKIKIYEQYGFRNKFERNILHDMAITAFQMDVIQQMQKNNAIVVEYAFTTEWQCFFDYIAKEYGYTTVVVNCNTRNFDNIWHDRIERDSSEKRPLCLTAKTFLKNKLYERDDDKFSDAHRNERKRDYELQKYTQISGDLILNDVQFRNIYINNMWTEKCKIGEKDGTETLSERS